MEKKLKIIGVITALPETFHARRILRGIFAQCEKYGYHVAVFSTMLQVCFVDKIYLQGELNIYELINYDMLDGLIVDTHSISEDEVTEIVNHLYPIIKEKASHIPVVSVDKPFGDFPCIKSDDKPTFEKIIDHFVTVHNCKDFYFLTGTKGVVNAEDRVRFFKEIMAEHGLDASDDRIFYGDFWYIGGAEFADRIVSGELRLPEVIVCANDHMAIGLVNRLVENGIRIPEDVMVCGFEATQEAALNDVSVSSFEANQTITAAKAVDYITSIIDPEKQIQPLELSNKDSFHPARSCGCDEGIHQAPITFKDSFYYLFRDYTKKNIFKNIDIGQLMEGYIPEKLTLSETPEKCFEQIYNLVFYLLPYKEFYLCLRDDWLYTENQDEVGYPNTINTVVYKTPNEDGTEGYYCDDNTYSFETKYMLPAMFESEVPSVYYFSSVHFSNNSLGYAVLVRELKNSRIMNLVYRNWLRFINTSLEMIRAKNKLLEGSIKDALTGAYNRRGMNLKLEKMISKAKPTDKLFICIFDMDNLKYINDNYGHTDGDFGIQQICLATISVLSGNEFCVRAGGDEFYLVGVGRYNDDIANSKIQDFYNYLSKNPEVTAKNYKITASAGYEIADINESMNVSKIINSADAKMYRNKYERKKTKFKE